MDFICTYVDVFVTVHLFLDILARLDKWKSNFLFFYLKLTAKWTTETRTLMLVSTNILLPFSPYFLDLTLA
jgi:hypothetical protein